MKKKYVVTAITILILVIAGVCYSCTYLDAGASPSLVTSLTESGTGLTETKESPAGNAGGVIPSDMAEADDTQTLKSMDHEIAYIYIHLCGAVAKPDVYRIEADARLVDAIALAGGLKEDAAGDYINQAGELEDGERIYIPTKDEVGELDAALYILGDTSGPADNEEADKLVDINRAGAEELMSLPGIGQAKADSIIEYRKRAGKFIKIEELMEIPGIKEGLFKQVSPYITVK